MGHVGLLGAPEELEEDPVEGDGVLDVEAVRTAADDDELRGGDERGDLLGVTTGVRTSWLPTTTIVGQSMPDSSVCSWSVVRRIARTCDTKAPAGLNNWSGPIQPSAGSSLRNERGPIIHRAASRPTAPMPSVAATSAQDCRSSSRHSWLRQAVATRVSDLTLFGCFSAMIWLMAPPMESPTTCADSMPASSSTAIASSAICSRS